MQGTLAGLFVVVALGVPIALYSTILLLMGTHPSTGRDGLEVDPWRASEYQPMIMLTGRAASGVATPAPGADERAEPPAAVRQHVSPVAA